MTREVLSELVGALVGLVPLTRFAFTSSLKIVNAERWLDTIIVVCAGTILFVSELSWESTTSGCPGMRVQSGGSTFSLL